MIRWERRELSGHGEDVRARERVGGEKGIGTVRALDETDEVDCAPPGGFLPVGFWPNRRAAKGAGERRRDRGSARLDPR